MSEGANTIGHSRKWVFGVSTQNLDLHSLWTILMCRAKQSGAAGNENSVTENPGFETHHQKIRIITKQKHPTNSKSNFDAKQRWKTRGVVFCLVTVYWVVKESVMQLSNKGEKTVYYTKIILCYFLFGVLGAKTAIVKFRVWEGKSGIWVSSLQTSEHSWYLDGPSHLPDALFGAESAIGWERDSNHNTHSFLVKNLNTHYNYYIPNFEQKIIITFQIFWGKTMNYLLQP